MSDEELCDLETLEALLETEDCDEEAPVLNSHSQNDFSQEEMEEFLNAVSEESDDDVGCDVKLKHNNVKNVRIKDKSFDGLPSRSGSGSGQTCKESPDNNPIHQVRESLEKSGSKDVKVKNLEKLESKFDERTCQNPTTQALQRELLMMQKKMEEMQKLLLQQQNKNVKTEASIKNSPSLPESPTSTKTSKRRNIHLMTDDEENPFFETSVSSRHKDISGKAKNSDKVKNRRCELKVSKKNLLSSKEMFGDSDSDWDGLDGEEKSTLSEEGKKIKKLLQTGQRDRQAHKSDFTPSDKKTHQSWIRPSSDHKSQDTDRKNLNLSILERKENSFSLKCKSSSSDQSKPQNENVQNEKIVTEDFSKIRMINPLVSSTMMKKRMDSRKLISISRIHLKINTPDLQGDWVTIGVIVGKTDAKSSNSGKPYSIWKLNDLQDLDNSVSFFLFGEVHKNHWKMDMGRVIGLLNPSMMDALEKGKSEPAFTVKNPNQLMVLGQSKDLGWCLSRTKKGNKCSHFVNKKQGDFCSYHVQAEYKKTSAKRLELQGSVSGIKPKSFEQKIFSKNIAYIYGGKTFIPNNGNAKVNKSVTIPKLQQNINSPHRINTLSIQNVAMSKAAQAGSKGRITEDKDQMFMDMLSVPSPGAMNLVAHMKSNSDPSSCSKSAATASSTKLVEIQSISATDLLKKHKQMIKEKQTQKRKASDLLLASVGKTPPGQKVSCFDPLREAPVLGKGLNGGQDISLSISPPTQKGFTVSDRSKLKAISILQRKGGITKEDPNAVRKQMEQKEFDAIQKRMKSAKCKGSSSSAKAHSSGSSSTEDEPPKKRSRLLGDIDLNSSEVKAILKAKSIHKGALSEAEAEREETYFSELEKKEIMEEKMKSVTSIEINIFTCKQCQYTAQSALAQCKTENHTIVRTKAKKRFFACKKCKERVTTITSKFPTDPCRKCGSHRYEKTSMYKEKAGPKLESEILSHRGDEVKFLNSLHHKVFLNTVIDK